MLKNIFLTIIFSLLVSIKLIAGESLPILVDGRFGEWSQTAPAFSDPTGDGGTSPVDFKNLSLANDEDDLFLWIDIGGEIILNSEEEIKLFLDYDNDSETGLYRDGMGADVVWSFSERYATIYTPEGVEFSRWFDLDLIRAPTVSSGEYEISLSRYPGLALNMSDPVRLFFSNDISGGDRLPDLGFVEYSFSSNPVPAWSHIPLEKKNDSDIRILTYNVLSDGLTERPQPFVRILQALNPDIINFQEIYDQTPAQVRTYISQILPLPEGEQWHCSGNFDCKTVSRFPVLGQWSLPTGNLAVLLDVQGYHDSNRLFIINAHPPCCSNDDGRQEEVDAFMSFLRDAQNGTGSLNLPENTPIFIVGDMNFVGLRQQLETVLTGDIYDNSEYGADFKPDWDATDLTDLISTHNSSRESYTWRSDGSSYVPGRLDFIFYSDSQVSVMKSFILKTENMKAEDLLTYGLQVNDTSIASDHLPHVCDFRLKKGDDFRTFWIFR